jgi:hypothetical protein
VRGNGKREKNYTMRNFIIYFLILLRRSNQRKLGKHKQHREYVIYIKNFSGKPDGKRQA